MLPVFLAQAAAELPHRIVYWNVAHPNLYVYPAVGLAMLVFGYGVFRRVQMWRQGRPDRRTDNLLRRGIKAGLIAGTQSLVLREKGPGLPHAGLFFGFVVLFIGTCIVMVEKYLGYPVLSTPSYFYWAYTFILNLFGALAMIGMLFLAFRRYVLRPKHLDNKVEDALIIGLILSILITGHLLQALRLAAEKPWWAPWSFVSYPLARLFWESSVENLKSAHAVVWLIHLGSMLLWLALIPFTKMWHLFAGVLAVGFNTTRHRGCVAKDPAVESMLNEEEMEDDASFGVHRIEELSWKNLLGTDACIRCGRCMAFCPASLTGKQLNPKQLIQDVKGQMEQVFSLRKKAASDDGDGRPALQGDVIKPEVLWACTTCRACEENCPMGIEHMDFIIPMRQYLTQMETSFPQEVTSVFKGMENNSNPWQIGSNKRFDWAEGLELKPLSEDPEHDILFFVGCAGSFDDRAIKVTKALVRILQAAGLKVGYLGIEEACCGETARRIGNEYLAQTMISSNVETFRGYGVKKIVTACPHCFNVFKNCYPDFGGDCEVIHHSVLIDELIRDGRISLKEGQGLGPVTYHDSCYLGRYNKHYDEPRAILKATPGLELIEPERKRCRGFCCGAGGGRMWMEEDEGERINIERTKQLVATGAKTLSVACPYCLTMISDGIKAEDLDESHKVYDVAEITAMHMQDWGSGRVETAKGDSEQYEAQDGKSDS
jgi:Fe-S oxidoreductase/nitrate reductase gamma subunit